MAGCRWPCCQSGPVVFPSGPAEHDGDRNRDIRPDILPDIRRRGDRAGRDRSVTEKSGRGGAERVKNAKKQGLGKNGVSANTGLKNGQ